MDPRLVRLVAALLSTVVVSVVASIVVPYGWPVASALLLVAAAAVSVVVAYLAPGPVCAAILGACVGLVACGPYAAACGLLAASVALYGLRSLGGVR